MHKFLATGAIGPFSRFRWPTPTGDGPGPWVESVGELRLGSNGVHACRLAQLPYWLESELWEIEVDDTRDEARHVLARRGRLIRRVEGWTPAVASELALGCVERSRAHAIATLRTHGVHPIATTLEQAAGPEGLMTAGYTSADELPEPVATAVLDAADTGFAVHSGMGTCLAAYLAARSAKSAALATDRSAGDADRSERRWQADWLADRLALQGAP